MSLLIPWFVFKIAGKTAQFSKDWQGGSFAINTAKMKKPNDTKTIPNLDQAWQRMREIFRDTEMPPEQVAEKLEDIGIDPATSDSVARQIYKREKAKKPRGLN